MTDKRHTHILNVDEGTEVTIMPGKQAKAGFFRFMHWVIDRGVLAGLPASATKVYLVIGRHGDYRKGTCTLSTGRIAEESGVSRREVFRAIQVLRNKGLIRTSSRKDPSGDKGNLPSVYQVLLDDPYAEMSQGGDEMSQGLCQKSSDPYDVVSPVLEVVEGETTAAAVAILSQLGIRGKAQLAILELIRDKAGLEQLKILARNVEYLSDRNKITSRAGYVRQGMIDRYELLPELATKDLHSERTQRAEQTRQRQEQDRRKEEQETLAETRRRREALEALPEDEYDRLIAEVMPTLPEMVRRTARKNPKANMFVQLAVYEKIKQEMSG